MIWELTDVAVVESVEEIPGGGLRVAQFSIATTVDGQVWAWGDGSAGQIGDGTLTDRLVPYAGTGLLGPALPGAGTYHVIVILGPAP